MSCQNVSRKIKSLEYSVEHLKLELEEATDEMGKYVGEFTSELYKQVDLTQAEDATAGTKNHNPVLDEVNQINDRQVQPDELKKIWKKIALVTHPDKTGNNPRLTGIYKKAARAWATYDANTMLQIAVELRLDISELSREAMIDVLHGVQKNLLLKLKDLESSVLLQWGRAKSSQDRENIMSHYIEAKGFMRKS